MDRVALYSVSGFSCVIVADIKSACFTSDEECSKSSIFKFEVPRVAASMACLRVRSPCAELNTSLVI